jgi:hypothetical protein
MPTMLAVTRPTTSWSMWGMAGSAACGSRAAARRLAGAGISGSSAATGARPRAPGADDDVSAFVALSLEVIFGPGEHVRLPTPRQRGPELGAGAAGVQAQAGAEPVSTEATITIHSDKLTRFRVIGLETTGISPDAALVEIAAVVLIGSDLVRPPPGSRRGLGRAPHHRRRPGPLSAIRGAPAALPRFLPWGRHRRVRVP